MTMTHHFLAPAVGIPAYSSTHGSLGWSSVGVVTGESDVIVIDTGGPGYRAHWDGWLASAGLRPEDVTAVLLTHCHWDHIGSVAWFPRAEIYLSRIDLSWAAGGGQSDPHLEPGLIAALSGHRRLHLIDDGADIRGVIAVATPGHTPGHTSYLASTDQGRVLVVGDAVKNRHELNTGEFAISGDLSQSRESWEIIRSLGRAGAGLLLGHDGLFRAPQTTPHAPFAPAAAIEMASAATTAIRLHAKSDEETTYG
jgi:N-acyl homoserine lactone hydrolase